MSMHTSHVRALVPHNAPVSLNLHEDRSAFEASRGHFLVPIRLEPRHSRTALLALEMISTYRTEPLVTLLHVVRHPPEPDIQSVHWLNAIDHLHQSIGPWRDARMRAIEQTRNSLGEWVDREVPQELRRSLHLRTECRIGEPAEEIARFAQEQAVDLIVLCSRRSKWRFPLWPRLADRILDLTEKPVLFVRPQPAPKAATAT